MPFPTVHHRYYGADRRPRDTCRTPRQTPEGQVTVKWGDKVLIERKTPKIDLPGSITLGDGIEIPAAVRA
ncbi:MAG: hypothetical protein HOM58_08035 [Rhodospirillaceae bacterium]|nr:hypothetical protein [Rhodospirillaceae bacterium]MBT5459168.1 hypothetical protein [Rhodospirillaceae bacterium]